MEHSSLTGTLRAGKTSIARRLVLVTADQKIKQYGVPLLWAR